MTFKKILFASLATTLLGVGAVAAEEVRIGIAAEPYPPFASLNASGEWTNAKR